MISEHVAMTALALSEAAEYRLHIDRAGEYPGLHNILDQVGAYGWRERLLQLAPIVDAAWHLLNGPDGGVEWRSVTEELDIMAFDFEFCPLALTVLTEGEDNPNLWDILPLKKAEDVAHVIAVTQTFARFARAVAA